MLISVSSSLRKFKLPEVKPNFRENDKCVKLEFVASKRATMEWSNHSHHQME